MSLWTLSCQNTWQDFEKNNILYWKWLKSGDHSWMQKENCVSFIETYLLNSYERTKTGCILCNWNKIVTSILQGLILGALHFNIFIFFSLTNLSFGTMQIITLSTLLIKTLIKSQMISLMILKVQRNGFVIPIWYLDKWYLMILGFQGQKSDFHLKQTVIKTSVGEKSSELL